MTDLPPENVQTYPRPPRLEPVPQRIRVVLGGAHRGRDTPRPEGAGNPPCPDLLPATR